MGCVWTGNNSAMGRNLFSFETWQSGSQSQELHQNVEYLLVYWQRQGTWLSRRECARNKIKQANTKNCSFITVHCLIAVEINWSVFPYTMLFRWWNITPFTVLIPHLNLRLVHCWWSYDDVVLATGWAGILTLDGIRVWFIWPLFQIKW
jgi:hypothetical protein